MAKRRLAALRNAATRMAASLARHRFVGRFVLVHGSPVHDVLRKARELDADLLVVVKNTRSWCADVLGASVSTGIATRADRDVLAVHGALGNRFGMPAY
jgi:nucleotide-binding universal stress UspA family protein